MATRIAMDSIQIIKSLTYNGSPHFGSGFPVEAVEEKEICVTLGFYCKNGLQMKERMC